MSGPVWKKIEAAGGRCASCLSEGSSLFAEGPVVDGVFQPLRTLCERCYTEHNPVLQKSPPLNAYKLPGMWSARFSNNRS